MSNYVTLIDAKAHLRVTISDDDNLIQSKINTAEEWINNYLGCSYSTPPEGLKEATKQLTAFFYDNREAAIVGPGIAITQVSPGFYDLLAPLRLYVF